MQQLRRPGAGGIHQCARAQRQATAIAALQLQVPQAFAAPRADAAGAAVHVGTAFPRGLGIGHHQAGVIDPAVGILEGLANIRLQRTVCGQTQVTRSRQVLARAEVIVEEQAGADQPGRPQVGTVRQDKTQRADQVGGLAQQHLALAQRFTD